MKNEKLKGNWKIYAIIFLVIINAILIVAFFVKKHVVFIESESVILILVGILATFVVVSNYLQVIVIKNETKEYIDKLQKEFDSFEEKVEPLKKEYAPLVESHKKLIDTVTNHYKVLKQLEKYKAEDFTVDGTLSEKTERVEPKNPLD